MLKDKNLYLVGGFVRDEIMGRKSIDIDYCYEGDAIEFAQKSGFNIIKTNPDFHTVKILLGENEIDIASTRLENYPRKGHLPKITQIGVPIEEDLKRRDFSINAIAKRTSDGKIIDIFDGICDIKKKTIKILHDKSFIDDPTRIIRGLKFSVRFGFELDEKTQSLQKEYLANVNYDMSYHRLKNELVDAFNLNNHLVFDKFISQKMYNLLAKKQTEPEINSNIIEQELKKYNGELCWLIYLSFFDISNLSLTKSERKVIEWAKKIETEDISQNTPLESILINKLKRI